MSEMQSQRLIDAQIGVIGSMLLDEECIAPVLATTGEQNFVSTTYRNIYRAIRELFMASKPVDPITVRTQLQADTGADYTETLLQIRDCTPTAANVDEYVKILRRDSVVWRLRQIGQALADNEDYDTELDLLEKANMISADKESVVVWDMRRGWEDFVERHQKGTKPNFLDFGFSDLNERIPARPGSFIVLGGYSSDGKTCLALSFAMSMAKTKRVGYLSLEQTEDTLTDRMLAAKALVSLSDITWNKLDEKAWEELSFAASTLSNSGLQYLECSGYTVADIQALALAKHFDVVIIDYLQLIAPERSRSNSRSNDVADISQALQQMAKKNKITVLALSQLTPGQDAKKKAPSMYDLRESKQQTMDADTVLLLYKEDFEDKRSPRLLNIAKNRQGEAGATLRLKFDGATQTFAKALNQRLPEPKKKPDQVSFQELSAAAEKDMPF